MKKTETIKDTIELWIKFEQAADFKNNDYDKAMLTEIKKELGFRQECDICKQLAIEKTTSEQLLGVLLKLMQPFSIMMNNLLSMFEAAGAQYTDNNLQIQFDFEKAEDRFNLDLNHFRMYYEVVQKTIQPELCLETSNPWVAFVSPVERILGDDDPFQCYHTPLPADIDEWLQKYEDTRQNWPDFSPAPPQSGVKRIDEIIAKIWQLPKSAIRLYRACYCSNQRRYECLKRKAETGNVAFYHAEVDCWVRQFVVSICYLTIKIKKLDARNCYEEIELIRSSLSKFNESLSDFAVNHDAKVSRFLDMLNLPIWKKRHALYSAWVATQIISASNKWAVYYNVEDGVLSFSFGGSVIAHLKYLSLDLALIAELRTDYLKPISKKRKSHIQPDYSLCIGDPSINTNTLLAVECKQYTKASKRNFTEAVIDYAGGRPNADIILVNYTAIPQTIRSELPSKINKRVKYFDVMSPSGEGCESFKSAIRNSLLKECSIVLSWSELPADLDLTLEITDLNGTVTTVDYSDLGAIDQFPYAKLDKDDRAGFGRETIMVMLDPTLQYSVFVNNFSSEETNGEITVSLKVGDDEAAVFCRSSNLTNTDRWHVFDFDFFSIRQINKTIKKEKEPLTKKRIFKRIETLYKQHESLFTIAGLLISAISLFFGGSLIINSKSFHTDIINRIEHQENYNYETVIDYSPKSTDYLSKAKEGDVYSQMWIAKYLKDAGNYDDAIYWYLIASERDSEYQAIAFNNLGWLYLNGYGIKEYSKFSQVRYDKAFEMFYRASELGSEIGTYNMLQVASLPGYALSKEKSSMIENKLRQNADTNEQEAEVIKSKYFSVVLYQGKTCTIENYHCTYSGSYTEATGNGLTETMYKYYGVIYSTDGQVENCLFIDSFTNYE